MDSEDREGVLALGVLGTILLPVIVLPLLILEAPWLLALAMVLGAGYWWATGTDPARAVLATVRDERGSLTRTDAGEAADPLAVLRERYACGEISEEEFERRLDRLLETEPAELARQRREREPARER